MFFVESVFSYFYLFVVVLGCWVVDLVCFLFLFLFLLIVGGFVFIAGGGVFCLGFYIFFCLFCYCVFYCCFLLGVGGAVVFWRQTVDFISSNYSDLTECTSFLFTRWRYIQPVRRVAGQTQAVSRRQGGRHGWDATERHLCFRAGR